MNTIGERLKQIRKAQPGKLSQEAFAETLKVTRTAYAKYEMDLVVPSDAVIKLVCQLYGKNERWLKNGEGNPDVERQAPLYEEIAAIMRGEDPFKVATMVSLAQMSDDWWNAWSAKLHEVLDTQKKTGRG